MNKIKILWRRFFILTYAMALLTGCDNPSMSPGVISTTSPVTLSPTGTSSLESSPTSTSTDILTQTPLASLTPTFPPKDGINQRCLEIENEFHPGTSAEGVLAFSGDDSFLLDLQTQEIYSLPITDGSFILDYEVSPDGKWLAYVESHYDQLDQRVDKQLRIARPDGQLLKVFHLPDDWYEMAWLSSEWLIFEHSGRPSGAMTLLNPFTGKWEELLAFPGIYDIYETSPVPKWIKVYNPTLSHVAYISDMASDGNSDAVLWDLISNKDVGKINHWSEENVPKWSPDGKQLAIVADGVDRFREEIFIVNLDGLETQLTNLAAAYPVVFIEAFNWSPNGRYIAFLMEGRQSYDDPGSKRLMILDVLAKQVTDYYCLSSANSLPYWSPDGQQFVLNTVSENEPSQVILVDIVQEYAIRIADEVSVAGWFVSPDTIESKSSDDPSTQVSIAPTPLPDGQVHQQCLAIKTDFSTQWIAEGAAIFNKDVQLRVLTSQNEDMQPLPDSPAMAPTWHPRGYISPNRKWLAYEYRKEPGENLLFLTTVDGKQQLSIPWPLEQRQESLLGWLDNERLVFLSGFEDSIIFYNPFTTQQEDGAFSYNFSNPFSDLENQYPRDECYHCQASQWPNPLSMIHEPTLTRLVYLNSPGQNNEPPGVVMKDLVNGQELWRFSHWDTFQHYPKWSLDGEQMAIALPTDEKGNHYELFSVDRDGQTTQLTSLADTYPVVIIKGFNWSPNGQHIAFWADVRYSEEQLQQDAYHLFVLDIAKQQITDYCIPGFYYRTPSPVWSPDSQQLLVYSYMSTGTSRVVLVDIAQNSAVQIGEDISLVGWMTTE